MEAFSHWQSLMLLKSTSTTRGRRPGSCALPWKIIIYVIFFVVVVVVVVAVVVCVCVQYFYKPEWCESCQSWCCHK